MKSMKKYIIAAAAVLSFGFAAHAQMRTAYFMEGTPLRSEMNPALAPLRGYVNFPAIGATGLNINNNFLSLRKFIYPNPTGEGSVLFLHESVDKQKFLRGLPNNNTIAFDTSLNLVGFGAYAKRFFWSAGINVKAAGEIVIPKNMFTLMTTLGQGRYDISNLNADLNAYTELYVGASVPIYDWLTVGARVKGLIGLASISASVDDTYVDVNERAVTAAMSGTLKYNSAFASAVETGESVDFDNIFDFGTFRLGSGGFAIDLGAEATFLDNRLHVSAAITDLGFISWSRKQTVNTSMGAGFLYEGYDFDNNEIKTTSDEFEMIVEPTSKGYSKRLTTALNLAAEYSFLDERISVGILSHTRFGLNSTQSEITLSGNFRPLNWLSASLSHTFFSHNRFGVFGFAVNFHPNGFNFFLGSDFINFRMAKGAPIPVNMTSMNLYMGLGFNFGKAHFRKNSKHYKE